MASYHWCPETLNEVFVLPATVADKLRLASTEQLQVLLWFSRRGQQWDEVACAADLGLDGATCRACLGFWVEAGVLQEAGTATAANKPAKLVRPAAVKPRVQDVLAYQREHPDFRDFLEAASATLGKAISHADTATLLYLLDTVGLSAQTVLLIAAYAMSVDKGNLRYIETLALGWADEGVTTYEAVNDRIRHLEACRTAADKVEALLTPKLPLNRAQAEMAYRWVEEWHFSDEMLRRADALATEKTGKFSPAYIHKVLERWHSEGVDTPEKIMAVTPPKKGAAATNPEQTSLDTAGFEQSLLRYRPKFKEP